MSKLPDDELDAMLEKHFSDRLDGQLGRAARAFATHHLAESRRLRRTNWFIFAGGVAAAAAIVLLAILIDRSSPLSPQPIGMAHPTVADTTHQSESAGSLEEVVWHRTLDEGTVFLDEHTPARKLVHQQVQELRWVDPSGDGQIETSVPREDVMLIALQAY